LAKGLSPNDRGIIEIAQTFSFGVKTGIFTTRRQFLYGRFRKRIESWDWQIV